MASDLLSADVPTERLLSLICNELGMDTAFIGRIADGRRTICHVAGGGEQLGVGDSDAVEESYCQLIVDGEIPSAIPDVTEVARVRDMAVTERLGIGSYLGLPLVLSDGQLYGTLCAYGSTPIPELAESDARLLRLVAALVADRLEDEVRSEEARKVDVDAVEEQLSNAEPAIVFQPIVDLSTREAVGYEALARFSAQPYRSPDRWFAAADSVGLGVDLEVQAIANAVAAAGTLPPGRYVTVNASPEVIVSRRLKDVLARTSGGRRVVVEVTEHADGQGLDLDSAVVELRAEGYRVALDDLGTGYSGLTRLLALRPDVVKLDRDLVRGIDTDIARRSLVAAAVAFASAAGGVLVAEGIETTEEAETVAALGVRYAQGYFFERPHPAAHWSTSVGPAGIEPATQGL